MRECVDDTVAREPPPPLPPAAVGTSHPLHPFPETTLAISHTWPRRTEKKRCYLAQRRKITLRKCCRPILTYRRLWAVRRGVYSSEGMASEMKAPQMLKGSRRKYNMHICKTQLQHALSHATATLIVATYAYVGGEGGCLSPTITDHRAYPPRFHPEFTPLVGENYCSGKRRTSDGHGE